MGSIKVESWGGEVMNWESGGPGLNLGFATHEPYDLGAIHKPNDHSYFLPTRVAQFTLGWINSIENILKILTGFSGCERMGWGC